MVGVLVAFVGLDTCDEGGSQHSTIYSLPLLQEHARMYNDSDAKQKKLDASVNYISICYKC